MKNNSHGTENTNLPSVPFTFSRSYNTKLFWFQLKEGLGLRDRPVLQNTDLWHYITIPSFSEGNLSICYHQSACKKEHTKQKIKFSMKDFFSKCDQIRSFLQISLHLLKKSLMENFIFCAKTSFFKNTCLAASYRKTPVLESLFNSEYCKKFRSTYFEEHLRTAASLKTCS